MMLRRKSKNGTGFTLVELLVVISIIALLVAIILPAISDALFRGKLTAAAANGRSIHQSVFAKETENIYTTTASAWPKSQSNNANDTLYQSSNEFFHGLVTNGTLRVGWNFFTAPGVQVAPDKARFLSNGDLYCAWSLTADLRDSTPETMPFLFTRNFYPGSAFPGQSYTEAQTGKSQALYEDSVPFGDKGMVFVTKGGSAFAPFKDDLLIRVGGEEERFKNLFNILEPDDTEADNTILAPSGYSPQ